MRLKLTRSFTAGELALITGGKLTGESAAAVRYLSTDTRELAPGDAFLALRGELFDGNEYLSEAHARGAALLLSTRKPTEAVSHIQIADGEAALVKWAAQVRREVSPTVVAVTGSVGKTTVKDTLVSVLSTKYRTHGTKGNLNNLLGVCFTLLCMPSDTELAVCEAGMNHAGELVRISSLLAPDCVLITNVGHAHIGNLGSRAAIARAKQELLLHASPGAYYLYPANEPLLLPPCRGGLVPLTVGTEGADCRYRYCGERTAELSMWGRAYPCVTLSCEGFSHAYAAAMALALGVVLGLSEEEIRAGIANATQDALRGERLTVEGVTLLSDCYNASPESMKAACALLMQSGKGRKLALLGDMLELGALTRPLHEEVGAFFAAAGLDLLFTFGAAAECIGIGARRAGMSEACIFSNPDPCAPEISAAQLKEQLREGDTLLIKASRALRAERIQEELLKRPKWPKGE